MQGALHNKWLWLLGGLILANVVYYSYLNWGLVTVEVTNAPLKQVISSIEWQAWVKVYTNLPPDSKVTMYVDHVPLREALETLSVDVDLPPRPDAPARTGGGLAGAPGEGPGGMVGARNPNGGGLDGGNPGPGGGAGGGRGGRGGGIGGGAQWNLAFFVGASSAQVQQEIRTFQADDPDTDSKVFAYGTPMQLVAVDNGDMTTPVADPTQQSWPGVKPPDPSAATTDATATAPPDGGAPADAPVPSGPPTVQTYLDDFAQSSNVWIMAPGTWNPAVPTPPPADSSLVGAIKRFIGGSGGTVVEAYVLRVGRGGTRGAAPGGDNAWEDRMRNAINGLPVEDRPAALDQLTQEVQFRKNLQALPPEQRRQKMFEHMMSKMINGDRLLRMSPVKRAQMFQRMVAARQAAKGK